MKWNAAAEHAGTLEQTHGELDGLCDWIEALQQQRKTKQRSPAGRKSSRVSSQTARKR